MIDSSVDVLFGPGHSSRTSPFPIVMILLSRVFVGFSLPWHWGDIAGLRVLLEASLLLSCSHPGSLSSPVLTLAVDSYTLLIALILLVLLTEGSATEPAPMAP